jgi:murein L,D-transpeptidase YafK
MKQFAKISVGFVIILMLGYATYKNIRKENVIEQAVEIAQTEKKIQKAAPLKPLNKLLKKNSTIEILIDKSDYQLQIFTKDTLVKTYPVVFGGNPVDDKLRQGDSCTPEGVFYINSKYPHQSWSKFVWINYPTADSWKKHNKAKKDNIIRQNATIGGEIGIHGVPEGMDEMITTKTNWTLGCISLTNKDINEIYPFIDEKTKITIQK